MAAESSTDRAIALVAALVAIAALALAVALAVRGDDEAPPATPDDAAGASAARPHLEPEPGLAAIDPGELAERDTCQFAVASAVLQLDPRTAGAWEELGLQAGPIPPAIATPTGLEFPVEAPADVACDLHAGEVRTSGGVAFTLGGQSIDLGRLRLDFGRGLVRMFPDDTALDGVDVSALPLGDTAVVQNDDEVTVIVPLRTTPDIAGGLSRALGQQVLLGGATLGAVHLVGARQVTSGGA